MVPRNSRRADHLPFQYRPTYKLKLNLISSGLDGVLKAKRGYYGGP